MIEVKRTRRKIMIGIHCKEWETVHEKIDDFLNFCLKHSQYIVLTKRANRVPQSIIHKMSDLEIECIKKRLERQLLFASKISDAELQRIDIKDKKSLEDLLRCQAKEEIHTVRKMENAYMGEAENLKKVLKPWKIIGHEYKFGSFFTWPGVWDICTFEKSAFTIEQIKSIYLEEGITIAGYYFEDLGFKDKTGAIWMKTCLHEGFFEMDLSETQLKEFELLNIPFARGMEM